MGQYDDSLRGHPLGTGVPFGATVAGLTQEHLRDETVRRALVDLWVDRGVILFRGECSREMQLELSRCFGTLEAHPFPETATDSHPELVKIKYYPDDGSYYDVNGELRGGWLAWHSDLIYTARINHGGILRPVQLPAAVGRPVSLTRSPATNACLRASARRSRTFTSSMRSRSTWRFTASPTPGTSA
jgi:taurine dioxygenase